MKKVAEVLEKTIELFKSDYANLDETLTDIRISDDKWTLKEIIGHLIDSASNNHQRFVRLKLSDAIEFPDYRNGEWLHIQNHNNMKFSDLLMLFFYYNRLMANIILNISEEDLTHKWNIAWDENSSFITLERLANHYVEHIEKHMTHFRERLIEVKNVKECSR